MNPAGTDVEYAFWTVPETSFTVTYSLGVFHEIDFQVNEGYRRIPHGGVETGGLLFGRLEEKAARIEAFRPIECEHASGPSFVLSERDLTALGTQLAAAEKDPELEGLQVVGWFIAHTRSPMLMNERESVLFDQLFPGAGRITLLIKPERFQPTRFGFLVRNAEGRVGRDASREAIILPLPGRATRSGEGPVQSIPAPTQKPAQARPEANEVVPKEEQPAQPVRSAVSPASPAEVRPEPVVRIEAPAPMTAPEPKPAMALAPVPRPDTSPSDTLPSIEEIRRRRSENLENVGFDTRAAFQRITQTMDQAGRPSNLRLAVILFLAAALGCTVGYWAYLQLPAATIALTVQREPSDLIVSWSPAQTRDAVYAAIRVDDGQQMPLSPEEKISGQAKVTPTGDDVKVELIAQHWMRDSRGIVRYVRAVQ